MKLACKNIVYDWAIVHSLMKSCPNLTWSNSTLHFMSFSLAVVSSLFIVPNSLDFSRRSIATPKLIVTLLAFRKQTETLSLAQFAPSLSCFKECSKKGLNWTVDSARVLQAIWCDFKEASRKLVLRQEQLVMSSKVVDNVELSWPGKFLRLQSRLRLFRSDRIQALAIWSLACLQQALSRQALEQFESRAASN